MAGKKLYVLSRAIETNLNFGVVLVVYLHIFYEKEKVIRTDDMFHHAVQHNKCSCELWILFINSHFQMDQRLETYKSAITALCQNACADKIVPFVLDIVLHMLNFISISDCKHKSMAWIDEPLEEIWGLKWAL